tara:strand:+ start:3000 stop:4583 length:1584 start_codon:yes stop_codon:yes gene_type:complete
MKKVVFIADFFSDQLTGGAELNDAILIHHLEQEYDVDKIHSSLVTSEILQSAAVIIVSNFIGLSPAHKQELLSYDYIIYEHDHKYVKSRDPSRYPNFEVPPHQLVNTSLYQRAKAVVVLSNVCKEILEKNLNLDNVHSIGSSLWSEERFTYIESLLKVDKNDKFAIINSRNPVKGTSQAISLCKTRNLEYDLIGPFEDPDHLLDTLAQYKALVFCPQVLETFSRISAEAKMLGCGLLTSPKMLGFGSEEIFSLLGQDLIDVLRLRVASALNLFGTLIEATRPSTESITVILNCYRRPEYLQEQIQAIRSQSVQPEQIWLWVNHHKDNEDFDFESLNIDRVIKNDYNWKFYGRFSGALLAQTKFVALFDDDTIPGSLWFENCLTTHATHPGILGGVGVQLKEERYYGHHRVGWSNPNLEITEVDLVGHAWFMERSAVVDLWREVPYCWDNGEDIQLSYLAQKYSNTKTYVPPHPPSHPQMFSSVKGMEYGVDEKATSRPDNHQVFYSERDNCVKNAIDNGWQPVFRRI